MAPELARLGHVALETPNLERSMEFYQDAVGFEETGREGETIYLRAVDEFDHHSISLTEADEPGVDHIAWQTEDADSVQGFADRLEDDGVEVNWIGAGDELGQGEAIRFETPTGHPFEIYHEMEKPDPPEEKRSRLKNRVYSPTATNPVAPDKIDHIQIRDPNAHECAQWMQDVLGCDVIEQYNLEDGSRWGTFVSACGNKIEAAVIQDDSELSPGLHHIACLVDDGNALFAANDAMKEQEVPTDGFGQHSISRGKFFYAHDEASGHRIEFNDGGYVTYDPNWEPVTWNETDLDERQWVGVVGGDTVPY